MLALKCTQKLLKDMKTAPVELEHIYPFFSWHANLLQLQKKHIIFVNDATRLGFLVDGIRSGQVAKLKETFVTGVKEYLQLEGVRRGLVEQYFLEAGEISMGKTNDRSVLGTLNEMSFYSQTMRFDHTHDLSAMLNSMIYKPIDYEEPIQVFKKEIMNRYS
ncbi:DUF6933 domain-containing protein [Paenibacillus sp. JSM ZJ436]|uniref:DUF6933 domain-containing protein n=1 Tax=Paenibacillus sp. JSM ZJ436 TaxID=3376190 RepID=UPI003792EF7D